MSERKHLIDEIKLRAIYNADYKKNISWDVFLEMFSAGVVREVKVQDRDFLKHVTAKVFVEVKK